MIKQHRDGHFDTYRCTDAQLAYLISNYTPGGAPGTYFDSLTAAMLDLRDLRIKMHQIENLLRGLEHHLTTSAYKGVKSFLNSDI